MSLTEPQRHPGVQPAPEGIESTAADNLRYIRDTIDAAHTFTLVPGRGCVLMGCIALLAATLEALPQFSAQWLSLWLTAAVGAAAVALYEMAEKAKRRGISLRRTASTRFFLTLAPAFLVGAILTMALADLLPRDAIAGIWLLTYGAGVAACGVFSIPVVLIAGGAFMGLGAVTLTAPQSWSVALLALGFGGIHIVLGLIVMRRYDG